VKFLSEFRNPDNPLDPDSGLPVLTRHLLALAIEFPGLWNLGPGAGPDDVRAAPQRLLQRFPLPPLLRKSFVRVFHALEKADPINIVWGNTLAELTRAVEVHPEGTLLYYRSAALFARAALRFGEARKAGFEEARVAYREAAAAPSLLPIRRPALLNAAAAEGFLYSFDRDPGRRRRIAEDLRGLLAEDLNQVPYKPGLAVRLAVAAQELAVARLFLDNWQRQAPEDPEAQYYRAYTEFHAGAYGPAVAAAGKVIPKKPGDTKAVEKLREEAGKIKEDALRKLKEQAPDRR
jgi:hypothetical protein